MREILGAFALIGVVALAGCGDAETETVTCDKLSETMTDRVNEGRAGADYAVGGYVVVLPDSEQDYGYSAIAAVELNSGPVTLLALGGRNEPPILAVGKEARRAFSWGSDAGDTPIGKWRDSVALASDASNAAVDCFNR